MTSFQTRLKTRLAKLVNIKAHSTRFWYLVEQNIPNYTESVKWLEVNGIKIT